MVSDAVSVPLGFVRSLLTQTHQDGDGVEKYDLPSPPKSATEVLANDAAEAPSAKENGAMSEDMRWARDRTGWAPRFEIPRADEDEGTLLDHQTFLEGKLDDKFFGGMWLQPADSATI